MTATEFAQLIQRARCRSGSPWWDGRCPAHNDHRSSLSWRDGDRGLIVECHAGCEFGSIADALGRSPRDFFHGNGQKAGQGRTPLTLAAFAQAKGLPVEFLREHGVQEDGGSLLITYRLRDGSLAARQRRRFALAAKDGSVWDGLKGVEPVAYGLWRLDDAIEKGELDLVEGETDTLTGWLHNIPTIGLPGADMVKTLTADTLHGIERLYVIQEPDQGGETFVRRVAIRLKELSWSGKAFVVRLPAKDLNALHLSAGDRFADELLKAKAAAVPLDEAVGSAGALGIDGGNPAEPELRREGLDLVLAWSNGVRFALTAIRDGRDGVRGELTVTQGARRLSWGAFALLSTQAREALRKKLETAAPGSPWGDYLEQACWLLTRAARQGEPLVTLTGVVTSPTRALLSRLLYEGEPTLLYGDGDTGKSLSALTVAVAVHAGVALPFGLKPARAVPAAYLDWETSQDTMDSRLGLLAAGLGVDPPAIVYKRMSRPLVDEAAALAAEFARRGVCFVIIDSMMFAVSNGEGAAYHEPITAFYNALRLFAPAATLVLSHVTGEDARRGGAARPFGGAFAFNGPRLIWEAKRDPDITDAVAIAFTCRKANNLARRPDPFGLLFKPGDSTITVYPFDLTEAAPQTVAGAPLPYRICVSLSAAPQTLSDIADTLQAKPESVRKALQRLRAAGKVALDGDLYRLAT